MARACRLLPAGRDVSGPQERKDRQSLRRGLPDRRVRPAPTEARSMLEALLGAATAVVASGGEWTNPETGEIEPKVHLHWRLKKPTATKAEHDLLREAREAGHQAGWWRRHQYLDCSSNPLAGELASEGNATACEDCCILRRQRDRSCRSGRAPSRRVRHRHLRRFWVPRRAASSRDDHAAVASALSVIPNNDLEWHDWNRIGMAAWAATDGSEVGREAFAKWSAKSSKNDPAATEARWQHYRTSPPEGRVWHPGLPCPPALAGMDVRKR